MSVKFDMEEKLIEEMKELGHLWVYLFIFFLLTTSSK